MSEKNRPRLRLTRGGWTLLAVATAIFGASFVHRVNLLLLLFALILAMAFVGALLGRRQLRFLTVRRSFPHLVPAGQRVALWLEVKNETQQPSVGITASDELKLKHSLRLGPIPFPPLAQGESARGRVEFTLRQRGEFRFGPARLMTSYPFGLVRWTWTVPESTSRDTIVVHPPIGQLTVAGRERFGLTSFGEGPSHAGLREGIDEFRCVRDYRDGDPPRLIHWRSTARRGTLVVRELDPAAARNILLLLHLRCDRSVSTEMVERTLAFTATLVASVCRDPTLQMTMVVADREGAVVRGSANRARVSSYLRMLALAEPTSDAEALLRGCRGLASADTRDRRMWVFTAGGLNPQEQEFLAGAGFRRVSGLVVLNASAGELEPFWNKPAQNLPNDRPTIEPEDARPSSGPAGDRPPSDPAGARPSSDPAGAPPPSGPAGDRPSSDRADIAGPS